ncbi:MAG: hypothetical protein ACOYIK_11050 [Coriobacteriales bacterium]|jgi:hypothetical protein
MDELNAEDMSMFADVRFTAQDLFILLKGMDTDQFICNSKTMDFDEIGQNLLCGNWRREMIEKYEPLDLVDEKGEPTKELSRALYPISKPNICISDVPDGDTRKERSAAIYLADGVATAVLSHEDGFELVPFGNFVSKDTWDENLQRVFGFLGDFNYSNVEGATVFKSDDGNAHIRALIEGDEATIDKFAEDHDLDKQALEDVARVLSGDDVTVVTLATRDYTDCTFVDHLGFTIASPQTGSVRERATTLVCQVGFESTVERNRRSDMPADYWRHSDLANQAIFYRAGFIPAGKLFDTLVTVDVYPED